jgi:CO dehydrogenase maturation factor
LNPFVEDIPDKFARREGNITLVVMGGVDRGGSGCACPENTFLRELLTHIVITEKDWVIVDMEAGVEHMGRATAKSVDVMAIVVEPTPRALKTFHKIRDLASDIGVELIAVVGNKIRGEDDIAFLKDGIDPVLLVGWLPFLDPILERERAGSAGYADLIPESNVEKILKGLHGLVAASA